jgi:hypothetical protein
VYFCCCTLFYLRLFLLTPGFGCAAIDPVAVEHRANNILGPETSTGYKVIKQKLGGMRTNHVFKANPPCITAMKHKAAEDNKTDKQLSKTAKASEGGAGSSATMQHEKKNRKRGANASSRQMRSRLLEVVFSDPLLLQDKGDSEDAVESSDPCVRSTSAPLK